MVKKTGSISPRGDDSRREAWHQLYRSLVLMLLSAHFAYLFCQVRAVVPPQELTTQEMASATVLASPSLPTCKSMMQDRQSPFHDGSFLTRHTIPISWHPREDASRELRHSMCQLHRYTANEARQCLAGKHVNFIGDSLTRYQYLSLAWFIHRGSYPPRFGRSLSKPCHYKDKNGQEACSPFEEPNLCLEEDFHVDNGDGNIGKGPWQRLLQLVGGKYFDGYLEMNGVRTDGSNATTIAENYFYATPKAMVREQVYPQKRVYLSFNNEIGWNSEPQYPIHGFTYTGCAFAGTCSLTDEMVEERRQRANRYDWDFSQLLEQAISPDGVLRKLLPPVNITLYNRGLWGPLQKDRAEKLMPLLYDFSQQNRGRCYFRATTGRFHDTIWPERTYVKEAALKAGCGYIDTAHLLEDFNELRYNWPWAPDQEHGNAQDERHYVYMDSVHFKPWVYEEINNMLLNILCNNA